MITLHPKTKPHYAWLVCLGGALAFCVGMGLVANLFSLCLPDIILTHGFTNAQGSWLTTTRSLFTLASMLVVNQLCARFGLRQTMTFGAGLVGVAYLLLHQASSFWSCSFACAVLGVGYCFCGPVPVSLALGKWFESRRSLALGLASAGSGVVTIVAPPIITWVQREHGLSASFLTLAGLAFVLGFAIWLLIRNSPAEKGLSPYHRQEAERANAPVRTPPPPMSPAQKLSCLFVPFLMAAAAGPGFSHVAVFFRSEGYDDMLVASLVSYLGLVLLVGKILCGQLYDRLRGRLGNYYIFGMLLAGQALFFLAPLGSVPLAFFSITVFGLGIPISSVSTARWAADLNDEASYPSAVRSITTSYTVGTLVFGPLPGMLADLTGSYLPSYLVFEVLLVLSLLILQVLYRQLRVE